ncbi:hypothetical protein Hanom_Chr06g00494721 [Helianthus anomalus]
MLPSNLPRFVDLLTHNRFSKINNIHTLLFRQASHRIHIHIHIPKRNHTTFTSSNNF